MSAGTQKQFAKFVALPFGISLQVINLLAKLYILNSYVCVAHESKASPIYVLLTLTTITRNLLVE